MAYLYHMVPEGMRGNVLYPLNRLKEIYPETYEKQAVKYAGRDHVMRQSIPRLDCLWNDALHLTAVHPQDVKNALLAAGKDSWSKSFYAIEASRLDPKDVVVYLFKTGGRNATVPKDEFVPYAVDDVQKYAVIPQATKDYYKTALANDGRVLLFNLIPHVLYKGTIDVSDAKILTV